MYISIIIPVYNAEKFLPKCIESVTVQSYKKIELILVNDGSTDASKAICEKYAQTDKSYGSKTQLGLMISSGYATVYAIRVHV